MALPMIDQLFLTRVKVQFDLLTNHVKLDAAANRLPPKVEMWVLIGGFLPILRPFFHCLFDEPRIIPCQYSISQLERVGGWRLCYGLHPGFSLVVDVLKLDCLVKVYHALPVILLLVGYSLVDGVALGLLGTHHLVIDVLALNDVRNLLHEFIIVFS